VSAFEQAVKAAVDGIEAVCLAILVLCLIVTAAVAVTSVALLVAVVVQP